MNRGWILVGGILVALSIAVVVMRFRGNPAEESGSMAPAPTTERLRTTAGHDEDSARAAAMLEPDSLEEPLARAKRVFANARLEHEGALSALADAERDLEDLENEIDAVERFVEEIVERGDDPAKFAEEGMNRLNPVIERYEQRMQVVEAADTRLAAAAAQLEAAKANLEAQQK